MKRILILYTAIGLGHKSMAENIGYHLELAGYQVRLADIKQVQSGRFGDTLVAVHGFINGHLPVIWTWLYRWGHYLILPLRVFIAGFDYKNTKDLINESQPDLVLATQTTASAVGAYLKQMGFYRGLFGIAFSDYHLHPFWLYDQADFYLANIEEQKDLMVKRGIKENKIFVCGMTLKPKPAINGPEVRTRLGIGLKDKVILFASGSLGILFPAMILNQVVEYLDHSAGQANLALKIIIACGKNEKLYKKLHGTLSGRAIVLGYYQPWAELCAISDIILTKPGGLAVAEALQWNLPMLITHWLPGQEALNYDYLRSHDLIMPGPDNPYKVTANEIVSQVFNELKTGEFRQRLSQNPLALTLCQDTPVVPAIQAVSQMFDGRGTIG